MSEGNGWIERGHGDLCTHVAENADVTQHLRCCQVETENGYKNRGHHSTAADASNGRKYTDCKYEEAAREITWHTALKQGRLVAARSGGISARDALAR